MPRTFAGGVLLDDAKAQTSGKAIADIALPENVILPLSQHQGSPARPVVRVGDRVKVGTKVAEADGFVSAPVHASISGVVRSIGNFPGPDGHLTPAIEIAGDCRDDRLDLASWRDVSAAEPEAIRAAVREAGVVGLGGATFPTHVKISPPEGMQIDTVVLNGAECEPYLSADHRLMVEQAAAVVEGLIIMMRATGARRAYIGVECNKLDAYDHLAEAARGEGAIRLVQLKVKYPQGAEKVLLKALVRREVPRGGLPWQVGCIVQNVATSFAVREAVTSGRPLTSRVVTVAGPAALTPGNFWVRIGTPLGHLIKAAGGASSDCAKVIMGGPMTGLAQASLGVPVVKGTGGVILLRDKDVSEYQAGPCIRCSRCVGGCPVGLMPNDLVRFVERDRIGAAREYGILDCIECGVCAYVCPSKIDHVRWLRQGKAAVLATERKASR